MKLKGEIIVLSGPRKIKFKKIIIDTNKIKPLEVVAKTLFSAISPGTETAAYLGKQALRPGKIYPRLLGYCNVAQVIKTGDNVKSVRRGDMILTGESHRSIFSISEENIFTKTPKMVNPKEAALAYLYTLGLNSLKATSLENNSPVAVIGLGVLGLGTIELAKNLKLKTFAFSDSQYKLNLAKKLGAEKVFLKNKNRKLEKVADLVITTSNSWKDWKLALCLAKYNGVISVLGFPGRNIGPPNFNPLEPKYFYDKKIAIIPSGLSRKLKNENFSDIKNNCKKILRLIAAKKLNPKNLISGTYNYKDIEKTYKKLLAKDQKSITYILEWPE